MKRLLLKSTLLLCALVIGSMNVWAADEKVTDYSNIVSAQKYYIGATTGGNDYYLSVNGSSTSASIAGTAVTDKSNATVFTFSGSGTSWTIQFESGNYLSLKDTKDNGKVQVVESASTFTLSNQSGKIRITKGSYSIQKNNNGTQFGSYGNSQTDVWLIPVVSVDPSSVATPTFTPTGGTYTTAQNVAITCETDGATIHYTTNGDEPTESDATYSSSISVTTTGTTLKAKAFKEGMDASSVATATYTIKPNTPTITAAGATVTVTGDDGCTFYYTTDGTAPDNSSTQYSAPFEQSTDCTIKAIAYDTYGNPSGVKSYTFKFIPLSPKDVNSGYYVKVTDASTLENGDAIIIVNETNEVALSTTQNTNNRGQESVTITNNSISPSANVQKLVLVKKTEKISGVDTDVFYFHTGSGYLYAASNSNNYLKTEDVPDDDGNARATIRIASGDATIVFTGTNTHNLLKYNSGNTLFSCYASTSNMALVQIYKEVPAEPSKPEVNGSTITLTTTANMEGWRSFYATKDYEVDENTTIYTVSEAAGSTVTLKAETGKIIPAGSAVVVKTTNAARTMTLTETATTATFGSNILTASDGTNDVDGYRLGYGAEDGIAFYKYTATKPAAGIVYIPATNLTTAPALTIEIGETTRVSEVRSQKDDVSGEYFNLNGQRVAQPTKGLYIVNGRKVLVP